MKKQPLLLLMILLGSVAALILRLLQNRTGFEPSTGLPIPGAPMGLALVGLLAALAAILLLLVRRVPQDAAPDFPTSFSTENTGLLTLPVMGILLLGLSGLADAAIILVPEVVPGTVSNISPHARLLFAATALLSAITLFPAAAACRKKETPRTINGNLLLVPPVCLVVRLVLTYRLASVNPFLQTYYVELLALVFMTLAFYRLSSFAFGSGRSQRYAFYSAAAVILSVTSLADGGQLSDILLHAGSGLTLLGFLLLHLWCRPEEPAE